MDQTNNLGISHIFIFLIYVFLKESVKKKENINFLINQLISAFLAFERNRMRSEIIR